jgi:hypothetical protein
VSDVKRTHRFLRSLLVAGASLLIIVGGAFAGNALAPASTATPVVEPAVQDDAGDIDPPRDEDAHAAETPEPAETDEAEPDKVDTPEAPPKVKDANEEPGAQGDEDDQGEADDANDADDAKENDADDANEDHDSGGEHDSGDSGDSGEHED